MEYKRKRQIDDDHTYCKRYKPSADTVGKKYLNIFVVQ